MVALLPRHIVALAPRHKSRSRQLPMYLITYPASANRSASAISSASKSDTSCKISAFVMPSAIIPNPVATGMCKPRTQGTPFIFAGSMVMREYFIACSFPRNARYHYLCERILWTHVLRQVGTHVQDEISAFRRGAADVLALPQPVPIALRGQCGVGLGIERIALGIDAVLAGLRRIGTVADPQQWADTDAQWRIVKTVLRRDLAALWQLIAFVPPPAQVILMAGELAWIGRRDA